jgi:hypothetical protein
MRIGWSAKDNLCGHRFVSRGLVVHRPRSVIECRFALSPGDDDLSLGVQADNERLPTRSSITSYRCPAWVKSSFV